MSATREVRINLNARVTVRLTPKGREMVVAYYRDILPDLPHLWPEVPAAGEPYSDQLWSIANMLGPALTMGAHPVIEGMTFTAPVGDCVEVVGGEPTPNAPGLDLTSILARANAADIPAIAAEVQTLRAALSHAIEVGAVAVNEALREGEEARAERDRLCWVAVETHAKAERLIPEQRQHAKDHALAFIAEENKRKAARRADLAEVESLRSRLATLESAPTFADGVRAGLGAAAGLLTMRAIEAETARDAHPNAGSISRRARSARAHECREAAGAHPCDRPLHGEAVLTARPFILLAMSAALGAGAPSMPTLRRRTRYEPRNPGDCPRCDGTRIARRTADGGTTPPHRCPECRRREA